MNKIGVLIVDDELAVRKTLQYWLEKAGYAVEAAGVGEEALGRFNEKGFSLVLLDIRLGSGLSGYEVLQKMLELDSEIKVIMISSMNDVTTVVRTMRLGAIDFLEKPIDETELLFRVDKLLKVGALERENFLLRSQWGPVAPQIVGQNASIRELLQRLERAAGNQNLNILITGESGTGKELFARFAYYAALRLAGGKAVRPFITVNCAAIPEPLLESTLFGHVRGAFTGAVESQQGKFEMAHGGDIFLDEIGALDLKLQAKLLRVIQEKEVERVGSHRPIRVEFRVISATNSDLEGMVIDGRFREDLWFRLRGVEMVIPPVRERLDDLPLLVKYFMEKNPGAASGKRLSEEVMAAFYSYQWPGNVRELEQVMENLILFSEGEVITPDDLPGRLRKIRKDLPDEEEEVVTREGLTDYLERIERAALSKILARGKNLQETAQLLKLPRSTLRSKLEKYQLI